MDKLLAVTEGIGQPLRPEDWEFIQNATKQGIKALVNGLMGQPGNCIVAGLVVTFGDGTISVSEGVVFINDELFYVPARTLALQTELWSLFLTPDITTGESRTFKDTVARHVYEYRHYSVGYATSIPSGSMAFPGANLMTWITSQVVSHVPAPPAQLLKSCSITYAASLLNTAQTLIPAPGAGTAVKVVSISAHISPSTPINAGDRELNVMYIADEVYASIGTFPNSFIESATGKLQDMTPTPGEIYINTPVQVGLTGTGTLTGSANIKFHCFYVIITL